jgi:hypothetical protein
MKKIVGWRFVILMPAGFGILAPVPSDREALAEKHSLLPENLEFYCDSFDTFREDLWEKAGHVFIGELRLQRRGHTV